MPQDQALWGGGVDLQLNGLWSVMGAGTESTDDHVGDTDRLEINTPRWGAVVPPLPTAMGVELGETTYLLGKTDLGRSR